MMNIHIYRYLLTSEREDDKSQANKAFYIRLNRYKLLTCSVEIRVNSIQTTNILIAHSISLLILIYPSHSSL